MLRVPAAQVRRWIRDRGLPAVLFDERYHLNRLDVLVWAQTNQIPVPDATPNDSARGDVSLAQALARGGIHRDVPGERIEDALGALLDVVPLPPDADRALVREMVLARQVHGETAIGAGIAIPHARFPIVVHAQEPVAALGFLRHALRMTTPDGLAVTTLFLLLTPTIRAHLDLCARLAWGLSTELAGPVQSRADDATILAAARRTDGRGAHA